MNRMTARVFAVALLFGLLFWVADAAYEYVFFENEVKRMLFQEPLGLADWLIFKIPTHDLYNRFLLVGTCLVGGAIAAAYLRKLRRREEELHRSESLLQDVFNSIQDGIIVMDTDRTILRVNRTVNRWCGWERSFVGQKCYDAFSGRGIPCDTCQFADALRTGKMQTGHRWIATEKGQKLSIETFIYPMLGPGGEPKGVVEYLRDTTDRRRHEAERHELEEQLRQAQKMEALGQLAGGVAHDFNNLLQVIDGSTDLALQDISSDDPVREELERVQQAADRAQGLVRQLLLFSRRGALEPRSIDVNDLIAHLTRMLHRLIGEHIELVTVPGPALPPVWGDAGQIEQVLMNLCVNARDAMGSGGRLTVETEKISADLAFTGTHPWADPGDYVAISVSDTGPGIPHGIRDRIFEPFFTTKEAGRGTGLGLATVYAIAQRHGGGVEVFSCTTGEREPTGTTIRVYLPASDKTAEDIDQVSEELPLEEHTGATILMAEDDPMVCELAQRVLEKAGFRVLVAIDGDEAVELFDGAADEIDIALLDVVMPGRSGRAVAEHIRASRPGLPVLYCSGYDFAILDSELVPEHDTQLMLKPYSPADLIREIRQGLSRARRTGS